ncbi:DUF5690 family protein [Gemmata sp. JC717]|uniref:DUF5690 family protein n=1 Tax=Gemmata algarum TaxID=2975278 RepID=A0ABU5F8E1_9BACT|nr:DUF5690 family protein [Gemmata algarum]MDY3554040.1 DUF5690 family protein [Gemmata algarum]MDY3562995.1 DUF5690 family protein [Gemmata algarum]
MSDPTPPEHRGLTGFLARGPLWRLTVYAIAVAFCTYFCMYAFRKPFDAAKFYVTDANGSVVREPVFGPDGNPKTEKQTAADGTETEVQKTNPVALKYLGTRLDLKTMCVIAQVIGYCLSKYLGTKICSETPANRRAHLLVGLILFAEGALLLFANLPPALKPLAMLLNGLPLGMVWGLCVRYLEGRRASEVMVAGLSCSYIVAGAATRDIARDIVMGAWGVSESWMPVATGLLFLGPFVLAVLLLDRLPPPSAADVALRSERVTMDRRQRRAFLAHFGIGFGMLLVAYLFLTALRDFRDHYGAEIFDALGLGSKRAIFTRTELWAMFGVIVAVAVLNLVANHRRALIAVYGVIVGGFALIGGATVAFQAGAISGYWWMAAVGLGMYLAYVPFGAVLFERMMAASRFNGTAVFAIQLADGVGYTGSVLVQLYRDLAAGQFNRLEFFVPYAIVASTVGVLLMTASGVLVVRTAARGHVPQGGAAT